MTSTKLKLNRFIYAVFFSLLSGGCSILLNSQGDQSHELGFIFISSIDDALTFDGIESSAEINSITFSNVPSGRLFSFPLKFDGLDASEEYEHVCENSTLDEFALFKNSALHVDLGIRQTSGALEFRCLHPSGLPFSVYIHYTQSKNAIVSSSSTLSPNLFHHTYTPIFSQNGGHAVFSSNDGQVYRKNFNNGKLELVTRGLNSAKGNAWSSLPSLSDDGRFVVFQSTSTNLVTGASGTQVYLKDMNNPQLPPVLVSSLDSNAPDQTAFMGNNLSTEPSVSGDGRFIAFRSTATNLVTGGGGTQIYRKDMNSPQLPPTLVSSLNSTALDQTALRGAAGVSQTPRMSSDGRFVVFASGATNFVTGITALNQHIYRKDMNSPQLPPIIVSSLNSTALNQTTPKGNGQSLAPNVSSDGRFVVFQSASTNFVTGASGTQVYLKDMEDVNSMQLPPILVSSLDSTEIDQTSFKGNSTSSSPSISGDGRFAVFASASTNFATGASDTQVYLKDLNSPQLPPIMVSSLDSTEIDQTSFKGNSTSNSPNISGDGRFFVFLSTATNFVTGASGTQVYLKDMNSPQLSPSMVSSLDSSPVNQSAFKGDNTNSFASVNGSGRFVVFQSTATNFVTGASGTQVYLKDLNNPQLPSALVSSLDSTAPNQTTFRGNNTSDAPRVSNDGKFVVFRSTATNFVAGASGTQVYLKDMNNPHLPPSMVSSLDSSAPDQTNFRGNGTSQVPSVSNDGKFVVFQSTSTNLVTGASGTQVYLKDMSNPELPPIMVSSLDSTAPDQTSFRGSSTSSSPSMSVDGRFIVFQSVSTNFVTGASGTQVYLKDMNNPELPPIMVSSLDSSAPDQTSFRGNGTSQSPRVSNDGRFVVFTSSATNFVAGASGSQVYLKDMDSPQLPPIMVSSLDSTALNQATFRGNNTSSLASLSGDGRFLVFLSTATNLVAGASGTQVYLKDMNNPELPPSMVSSLDSSSPDQTAFRGNSNSDAPVVSSGGKFVVYQTNSTNLVTGAEGTQIFINNISAN